MGKLTEYKFLERGFIMIYNLYSAPNNRLIKTS